jgi:hypothetical protein
MGACHSDVIIWALRNEVIASHEVTQPFSHALQGYFLDFFF